MNEETQTVEVVEDDKRVAAEPEQVTTDPKDEQKSADADVDDRVDALAGLAAPLTRAHAVREGGHAVQDPVDVGDHVLGVDDEVGISRKAERRMEDRPVLCRIYMVSPEHGGSLRRQLGDVGQLRQGREDLVGDQILRQIDVEVACGDGQAAAPLRIVGEHLPQ